MGDIARISLLLVFSFLAGSIPSAYIAGRLAGKGDIRKLGSGNPGATNAYRVLGLRWALPVVLADFFKGFVPVAVALVGVSPAFSPRVAALAGAAAVAGHMVTPWLSFRGGKGVATGAGAFTAFMPLLFPVCLAVFIAVLGLSRRMSLASLCASLALPVAFVSLTIAAGARIDPVVTIIVISVPVAVLTAHAGNIARLRDGTEPRLF